MKLLLLLMAGIALATEPAQPTDADKLKIREAQLARMTLVAQIAQLEGQYRDLRANLDKATQAEKDALAELARRLNCAPDPQTLACARPETPQPPQP